MFKIELTPEQLMLQDTASRYMEAEYGFRERSRIVASGKDDATRWESYAEMGWLGLVFPEEFGGGAGDMVDLMVLMQAFGRSLAVEPYLASVVLGGLTVLSAGTAEQKERILPSLIAGKLKLAFAFAEPQSAYDPYNIQAKAERAGNGFVLSGDKAVVLGASSANYFVVAARTGGSRAERQGISLFLVDATSPGISLRDYQTLDGRRAAEVRFDRTQLGGDAVIGRRDDAAAELDQALLHGKLAVLGEAVGCLDGALSQTISHLNTREQFGKKLSTLQALRHRVAGMYMLVAEARALSFLAAQTFVRTTNGKRSESAAAAKAYVGLNGQQVCREAVQLHGAIAIADEYIVGHYLKRLIVIDRLFGNIDHHIEKFTDAAFSKQEA
jgi:alkylation response protein AidB-like acyl-CoA dehydrogenase